MSAVAAAILSLRLRRDAGQTAYLDCSDTGAKTPNSSLAPCLQCWRIAGGIAPCSNLDPPAQWKSTVRGLSIVGGSLRLPAEQRSNRMNVRARRCITESLISAPQSVWGYK